MYFMNGIFFFVRCRLIFGCSFEIHINFLPACTISNIRYTCLCMMANVVTLNDANGVVRYKGA